MDTSQDRPQASTDVAALSASVVAAAVTLVANPGPWDAFGVMISTTITLLIVAYSWDHFRWWLQSAAIAGAIAFGCLPIMGFIAEILHGSTLAAKSSVAIGDLIVPWIILLILIFVLDRLLQLTRRNS